MIKITLSEQERRQLEDTFKTTAEGRLRIRCQAILMAHRGRRHRHIAEDLGVTVRTLQRGLRYADGFTCQSLCFSSLSSPNFSG